ncbi:L-gulonolactone/D-arabinono-1,4-lactone oxidase [Trametes meyenii]|nr:L-gulonolactone/D-arabinono-1,4-lactone oxidase [Trametes meyenii]
MSSESTPASSKAHAIPLQTLYELLAPVTVRAGDPRATFTNWGLSFTCTPLSVFQPETERDCELILELARREGKPVRVAGVGHSPSDLACTTGFMLRTEKLNKVVEVSERPCPCQRKRGCERAHASRIAISSRLLVPVWLAQSPVIAEISEPAIALDLALISFRHSNSVNVEKRYVVAQAGIILSDLHVALAQHGLAMRNLGSISDQTLGGVVTTATHGTGMDFPVLSTYVCALVLLLADGSRVRCSREENHDLFMASICGIGSTGLILEVTLEVEPAFRLREVQETQSFDEVVQNLDSIARASQHVRLWWFPQADVVRVSSSDRTNEPRNPVGTWLWHSLVGYHLLQFFLFVGRYVPDFNLWTGRFAAWLIRDRTVTVDDSHRVYNIDCKYPQYTTEWAVSYEHAQACLREMRTWLDREFADPAGLRPHGGIEVRFSAADDIWLSPSNGERTCWIGLVQYKPYGLNVPYRKFFAQFEELMIKYGGKPHWAKTHPLGPAALRALYPRFDDFVRVLGEVDPRGTFRNPYVQRHIFGNDAGENGPRVFKKLP